MIGVLVLGVVVMTPNPTPPHVMRPDDLGELLPQLHVLEFPASALPSLLLPGRQPLGHALHQVFGVGDVPHARVCPLAADPLERRDRAGDGHPVVRRLGGALVKIPASDTVAGRGLDERPVAARTGLGGIVPEAALGGVDQHVDPRRVGHQGWITTGMSVCRRISSAWETTGWLGRPDRRSRCAPANSASQLVRAITRATTSPGEPPSMCVTNGTPSIESTASAAPTTCTPASRSGVAWITCTVLSKMLAKRAARPSARRLVSPPSNATAQDCIGEGAPPHTMTHFSAIVISELTVGPSASAAVALPRRPTKTASTVFASSASTRSGLPSRSTSSTASPAASTRSLARASRAAPSPPPPPSPPCASRTVAATSVAPKRCPSWTACSRAASARGLPSRPISRRVNMGPSREDREPLEVAQPERQHFTRHRQSPLQELVPVRRLEPLGDHHIFGAPAHQRHPAMLAHRALERIERVGRKGAVLGDCGHGKASERGGARSPRSCPGAP